jgi:hypothetical protein
VEEPADDVGNGLPDPSHDELTPEGFERPYLLDSKAPPSTACPMIPPI